MPADLDLSFSEVIVSLVVTNVVREAVLRPKETLRKVEDIVDAAGDLYHNRNAAQIYSREIPKAVRRAVADITDNWKNAYDGYIEEVK